MPCKVKIIYDPALSHHAMRLYGVLSKKHEVELVRVDILRGQERELGLPRAPSLLYFEVTNCLGRYVYSLDDLNFMILFSLNDRVCSEDCRNICGRTR